MDRIHGSLFIFLSVYGNMQHLGELRMGEEGHFPAAGYIVIAGMGAV